MRIPLLLAALVLALPTALAAQGAAPPPTITVTGQGSVSAVPDMARITLGVSERRGDAGAAMAAVSESVGRVLERLDQFGLDRRDIQTTDLSVQPVWVDRMGGNQPQIDGYEASNQVTIRVRALDSLGAILDAALGDGANRLSGLSFSMQDPEPLMDAARRDAVADAQARATLYAEAAGVTLGRLLSLSEGGEVSGPRPMDMRMAMEASVVPVEAGETTLSASVTMVYAID